MALCSTGSNGACGDIARVDGALRRLQVLSKLTSQLSHSTDIDKIVAARDRLRHESAGRLGVSPSHRRSP